MNAAAMTHEPIIIPQPSGFRAAMILAIIADALQILVFPLFIEGAVSPADDLLDLGIGAVLAYLLGWHWEFLHHSSPNSSPVWIWFRSARCQ
jgi:hypothetical protein